MDYSRFITEQTQSKKKIILITIIMSIILVGLIILLVVVAVNKKKPQVTDPVSNEVAGEFILEQENAAPTSTSTADEEAKKAEETKEAEDATKKVATATSTSETSKTLPKTGPSDMILSAVLLGTIATLGAYNLEKRSARR